jgi:hypothetical protein
VLRLRASVPVLAALAFVVAGCGSHSTTQRPALASYIDEVNHIEKQLAKPFQAVTNAGSKFASTKGTGAGRLSPKAQEQTLVRALHQIQIYRLRLARIPVPRPATHLRRLLLRLIGGEARMTTELAKLVAFLPRFSSILASLSPATAKLQSALRVTTPLGYGSAGVQAELNVKAKALHTYEFALFHTAKKLELLDPPALSRPQFVTQIKTLERMQASAGKLADALAGGSSDIGTLLQAFDKAAGGNQSVAAQKAQIAAIKAYDARAARLDKLARAVELERTRLDRNLK